MNVGKPYELSPAQIAEIERINEKRRTCDHKFVRTGYSMGCVTFECEKCGEFDEKDVS